MPRLKNQQHSVLNPRQYPLLAMCFLCFLMGVSPSSLAEDNPGLFFKTLDTASKITVDHKDWQSILDKYVYASKKGFNLFRYANISKRDRSVLRGYLNYLASHDPRTLSKKSQKAYWINLYNAATVDLVLAHYPVKSITKIHDSFFAFGPWDDHIVTISDQRLTLNDIEHRILRPFFKDHRLHYALNCASYSCPQLSNNAFTRENMEQQLEQLQSDYLGHKRGLHFDDGELYLSKIYKWYLQDFAKNEHELLLHLSNHVDKNMAKKLINYRGDVHYDYNWDLNE